MRLARALILSLAALSSLPVLSLRGADAVAPTTDDAERFFESEVRPMLVARCLACHGPEKQEGGLRLDTREAVLKGGDSAAVVVPGEPDKSPLIEAIRYDGPVQMPPTGKLEEKERELLTAWVKMGVPWGRTKVANAAEDMQARATRAKATHWAYQPIARPEIPAAVSDPNWSTQPIDRFILAELDRNGLRPSAPADRRTLLRRATYDLTGLPPTPAEVTSFENDAAPDAFARVVDRLLASPAYGQRWGRYWLDVARYSDTKGYVFTEDRRFPYAYTYRDYVVRALNEDRPYDEFVRQQIAADLLPVTDRRDLAAMGFLTVGRRFSNNIHDIIDDRIDVVTRGMMGLTVTCARCHDHKYDPLPTDDYYSLYGIFASSPEPGEPPLIGEPQEGAAYDEFTRELAKREQAFNEFRDAKYAALVGDFRQRVKDYLCQVVIETMKDALPDDADLSFNSDELRPVIVRRWRQFLERKGADQEPIFGLWHEFGALPREGFAAAAQTISERLRAESPDAKPVNRLVREAFVAAAPKSMLDVARTYGDLLAARETEWVALTKQPPAAGDAAAKPPERLPTDEAEQLRQVMYAHGAPPAIPVDEARRIYDRATQNELGKLRRAVDEIKVSSPAAPARAMVLNDAPTPHKPHVFLRGDPARPDREVPRRFVQFLSADPAKVVEQGSGRLEMAQAISSPDNPLTPRVLVNRVWMHHFGAPLVATPGDFGLRSEPPSHPQLLDYLARGFIDEGWSLKRLHRQIMLSNTYAQASDDRPECRAVDPQNRWLWRANRRRLDFEAMRDSLLVAAGRLDGTLDGRSIDIWAQPFSTRRSIYAYVDRQDLPGIFRMFDFASPDVSMPQRPSTTVPQQALFALNSAFMLEQARHLAARTEVTAAPDADQKIQALYQAVYSRAADTDELALAREFLGSTEIPVATPVSADPATPLSRWQQYAQALLVSNEFMFVD